MDKLDKPQKNVRTSRRKSGNSGNLRTSKDHRNSQRHNTGHRNSQRHNTGHRNSQRHNTGHRKRSSGGNYRNRRRSGRSNEEVTEKNFYNPRNKLVTKEYIEGLIQSVVGLPVKIKSLYPYQLAFVHKSVYKKNIAPPGKKEIVFFQTYESLEFVGDAWVGAIVADYLYHRFPGQDEGFLTKLRTKIVCSKQMAKYSEFLGLSEYVLITPRIEKAIGRNHVKILEDIFEALCAAIKQDLGVPILQIFVKNLIEATANFTNIILFDDDYKTMLLQYFQKHGWPHPTYSTISHEGPGHQRVFTMGLDYLDDFEDFNLPVVATTEDPETGDTLRFLSSGVAKNKKEAEQVASKEALIIFGILPSDA